MPEEILDLDQYPYDVVTMLELNCDRRIFVLPIILETKHINHNSTLRFSFRLTGGEDDYQDPYTCITVSEPLTLAYI